MSLLTNKLIPINNYRIFSIIAHIDHGKSTLSDRLLELTGVIQAGANNKQILDKLEVERRRGITIKAQSCTMIYRDKYLLQLIDTPGHVDFRDEVYRSMTSVDGSILLVDALKGVQAQTIANYAMAKKLRKPLIPVVNKIDLNYASIEKVESQLINQLGFAKDEIIRISAKSGLNIESQLLPAIIDRIPSPKGINKDAPFRAMVLDSWYDAFTGVTLLVKVIDGKLEIGNKIISALTEKQYEVKQLGVMSPNETAMGQLSCGQVGFIILGLKNLKDVILGDTLLAYQKNWDKSLILPKFEEPKPMVFVGAFPANGEEFRRLDDDINRLVLNDKSVTIRHESSNALGKGWRLGFLGTLHASVFKERLEKEYGSQLIITHPTVPILIKYKDGTEELTNNPSKFPEHSRGNSTVSEILEPFVQVDITAPSDNIGAIIQLCDNNRGEQMDIQYDDTKDNVTIIYKLPMSQLIDNFFTKLKSATHGFATLDYQDCGYQKSDLVKLELLVNGNSLDALCQVVHKSQAAKVGREWVTKFKQYLDSQLFEVIIQAKFNGKIIARETIKARRKDVLAKLHASDISRRKKLLEKQKAGKKALKQIGNIQISQEAYQSFLRR